MSSPRARAKTSEIVSERVPSARIGLRAEGPGSVVGVVDAMARHGSSDAAATVCDKIQFVVAAPQGSSR